MICRATIPTGRLNAFQRVMLQWSELHPYNAAHTYRLSGPLCLQSLRQAIRDAFDHNGLGVAEIDPDGVWYRHEADDESQMPEIELVAGDEPPEDRLVSHLARELNRPFERPRARPSVSALSMPARDRIASRSSTTTGPRTAWEPGSSCGTCWAGTWAWTFPRTKSRWTSILARTARSLPTGCKVIAWHGPCCVRFKVGSHTDRRGG